MCLGLMEEEWDVAIILDACRYDTFKEVYRKYLPKGKLEKRIGANETLDWLKKNFNDYHDVVYISGHPGINSFGIPWGGFNARDKFHKVIDVWLSGWSDELNTTLPSMVSNTLIKTYKKMKKRVIAHYMQPHIPYRLKPYKIEFFNGRKNIIGRIIENVKYLKILIQRANNLIKHGYIVGHETEIELYYFKNFSVKDLLNLYTDNLRWVLESVKDVVNRIKGRRIVITSDHGEAFGEKRMFFHPFNNNNPVIRIVPFLVIET